VRALEREQIPIYWSLAESPDTALTATLLCIGSSRRQKRVGNLRAGAYPSANHLAFMRVNLFEGARRVLRLLQALWIIGAAIIVWNSTSPYPSLELDVQSPFSAPVRGAGACSLPDQLESVSRWTANGTNAFVWLCFRASKSSDGRMLIPFRWDDRPQGKMWWGEQAFSPHVSEYVTTYSKDYKLTTEHEAWIDSESRKQRFKQIWVGLGVAVGGCLVLTVAAFIVGWIVRGFLGIPSGHDSSVDGPPTQPAAH